MTKNNISISLSQNSLTQLFSIMQHGAYIKTTVNIPVGQILTDILKFSSEYLDSRVDAIFLNGHPVDNIDTAILESNARLGLAGALPGAAGIAMRRNSPVAALRGGISLGDEEADKTPEEGEVTLLLFNSVMHEHAERFLANGIETTAGNLLFTVKNSTKETTLHATVESGCEGLARTAEKEALMEWCAKNPKARVHLRVQTS